MLRQWGQIVSKKIQTDQNPAATSEMHVIPAHSKTTKGWVDHPNHPSCQTQESPNPYLI